MKKYIRREHGTNYQVLEKERLPKTASGEEDCFLGRGEGAPSRGRQRIPKAKEPTQQLLPKVNI